MVDVVLPVEHVVADYCGGLVDGGGGAVVARSPDGDYRKKVTLARASRWFWCVEPQAGPNAEVARLPREVRREIECIAIAGNE